MHIASNNAVWVICFVLNFILFLPFLFFYNQLKYNEFTQKSKLYEAINYYNNISVFANNNIKISDKKSLILYIENKNIVEVNNVAGKSSNKMEVPEAKAAMDRFKTEVASELGVNLKEGYNGDLTSREAGSIGGEMVKRMIQRYEDSIK